MSWGRTGSWATEAIFALNVAGVAPICVSGVTNNQAGSTNWINAMRFDKLTTKLQEALSEAQSLALGRDQQYIEPAHLLPALPPQEDGGVAARAPNASPPSSPRRPATPPSSWARSAAS